MAAVIRRALETARQAGEPLSDSPTGIPTEWWKTLDHAVGFRDRENPLDPRLVVTQVRRSLLERQSFAEVGHTPIVPFSLS